MKVFCQDCVWISRMPSLAAEDNKCGNPYNMKEFVNRNRIYMKPCRDLNKDGQCKHYKREWYKFWRPKTPDKIKADMRKVPGGPIRP